MLEHQKRVKNDQEVGQHGVMKYAESDEVGRAGPEFRSCLKVARRRIRLGS